jgi:hypothetical protein
MTHLCLIRCVSVAATFKKWGSETAPIFKGLSALKDAQLHYRPTEPGCVLLGET